MVRIGFEESGRSEFGWKRIDKTKNLNLKKNITKKEKQKKIEFNGHVDFLYN